ncbi:MAG: sensor histidine kinase [Ruminococcus sp.]
MEEKKQRGLFYSKGLKIAFIVVFFLCVGVFSIAGLLLAGLLNNGMRMENFGRGSTVTYEETYQCGSKVAKTIMDLASSVQLGKPFFTDGEIDPEKTVDITNLKADEKDQNPNTTYKVKDLQKMLENDYIELLQEDITEVQYGYYDEGEVGEYSDEMAEFSGSFQYLYSKRKENEAVKTQAGEYLADYAMQNPDTVSLIDLYKDLVSAAQQLEHYFAYFNPMEHQSNVMFVVEDLDEGVFYTNVPGWEKGFSPDAIEGMEKKLFFQAERKNGTFTEYKMKNNSDAEEYLRNYFSYNCIVGQNEKLTLMLNAEYPMDDEIFYSHKYFAQYSQWGNVFLLCSGVSLVLGILMVILLSVQTGRVRQDRELHLRGSDKVPTEVAVTAGLVSLVLMVTMVIPALENGEAWEVYIYALLGAGEMLFSAVILWAYLSIVRRMKGHIVWKTSLIRTIIQSCKNVYMARKTSGRMITAFILLVLGNVLFVMAMSGFGLLVALLADGIVLLYLIRENAGRQVIRDGLARIASGELDFKIDEKELIGDNKEMAEAVNHVGDGLQNAVKETLKSERLKADLITNVSHDIKTPLTSIINYVDLLKRENIQDPKIKGYIDILDSKSQRLKQLTEDLVEASKISSGNVVLDMQPIRFGELVWQTNGEFEEKFRARGLEIVCKIPEEPMIIMADGRRMWRVVENLYNNVAKYAMPDTRVYVEVRKIGCRIVFEIKNISERPLNIKAEELTERFIRGDVSRSTEGSGLGLSIAQNMVRLQQGTFDIYLDGDLFKVTITFEAAGE